MIADFLHEGREHAISTTELSRMLHLEARDITKCIQTERLKGYPICSSSDPRTGGYYLASCPEELAEFCGRLRHRVGEQVATIDAMEAAIVTYWQ